MKLNLRVEAHSKPEGNQIMPINLNLWTIMLSRWMGRSRQPNVLTTIGLSAANDHSDGDKPRRGQAPPALDVRLLSAHLRRDIGLELDRA
ncbi:hypothetical protein [Dongia rigui]|uniref:Uncharacterized protein n=1 Tax=Dongia rigui TaxID=940149 RepID=A0ABU5DTK9_9PROT|nr:hypothetical protein [Dongia rigui]MDY0870662.1 hypothetical protein [Dongia rigui]